MLFGKDENIQSALLYYKIDCVLHRRNTDRYDDRFTSFGNIIDGYMDIMNFFERYFPDPFYMERDQRVSLRNKVFRKVVANMLIHREYLNPSISMIDVRKDYVLVQNANRPLRTGVITPDNYTPHPKNPHMANFFVQMGRAEHLGTGVRNLYHYAPIYLGAEPTITDDDMFRIRLNIAESKQAEMAMGSTANGKIDVQDGTINVTINVLEKIANKLTERQRLILQRLLATGRQNVLENVLETSASLAQYFQVDARTIRRDLNALQSQGIIRRVGPDRGGHWEIIEQQ